MRKVLFNLIPLAIIALLFSSYSGNDDMSMYPQGAPAGYTGSPADGHNCTQCHGGSATTVQDWITSDVGTEGYVAGQTYTITVTVTGSGKKGFEVSPQNSAGDLLGTLIAGSGEKLVGSGKYVTHTSSSNSNPKVWTFQWTAPAAGTGEVTMYGAFALNTSSTRISTLLIPENTSTGIGEPTVAQTLKVFPNPLINNMKIGFTLDDDEEVSISIVNAATGMKKILLKDNLFRGQQSFDFDASGLQAGLYIVKVESANLKLESKLIVRH
jgi:hypothetical protein